MNSSVKNANFRNQIHVIGTAGVMLVALVMAFLMRSWSPLIFFGGLVLVLQVISGSAATLVDVARRRSAWDAFTSLHVAVAATAVAFLLAGAASLAERMIWFGGGSVPGFIVAKDYGDNYTANKHRMFKMICEGKEAKGPLFVRQQGDQVFARCGDWYPQVYVIAASKSGFARAVSETANDPPGMPVVIESDSN